MKIDINVPSLGESISEVTIGQILTPSDSFVQIDSEILELETDKVNQLLYASQAGKITLNVKMGDSVKIGQTIGTIETDAKQEAPIKQNEEKSKKTESSKQEEVKKPALLQGSKEITKEVPSIAASKEQTVSKGQIERYQKEDFLTELQSSKSSSEQHPKEHNQKEEQERETRRPLSKIRKVIAQRLVEAQHTMAMLTTFNEVDMTPIMQLREKYKEGFTKKYGSKLGLMSFFVKATVSALQAFPDLNSYIEGDEIVRRNYYDIGVAVGTEKGVIVPIIRNCDQLSFAAIEQSLENYAKKSREGKLTVSDLQGGGFTITNGGTYGSLLSTPILISPQCGILGMHKIEKRPVVVNDVITIRSMMYLALSYDHRLIDGKEAVSFLVHIKNMLEDTSRLVLEI